MAVEQETSILFHGIVEQETSILLHGIVEQETSILLHGSRAGNEYIVAW